MLISSMQQPGGRDEDRQASLSETDFVEVLVKGLSEIVV